MPNEEKISHQLDVYMLKDQLRHLIIRSVSRVCGPHDPIYIYNGDMFNITYMIYIVETMAGFSMLLVHSPGMCI